ncbi:MAG: HAMP domain-containing histidine kinase [Clostridia bacterium]|nr:HAMP domain-containing histidine kinase [Clostridia bacterium]
MRKRPILLKFFLIFTITIVVSSVLSGVLMSGLVQRYMLNTKQEAIVKSMDSIQELWVECLTAEDNAKNSKGEWISETLQNQYLDSRRNLLNTLEQYDVFLGDEAYIFIADTRGEIAYAYPRLQDDTPDIDSAGHKVVPDDIMEQFIVQGEKVFLPESAQYAAPLKQSSPMRDEDDFYGLYKGRNVRFLTVSKRVVYLHPESKTETLGGLIIISVPIPNVVSARNTVVDYFVLSTIGAVILELVILSYFTKKLTDPLRELKEAAARVADGAFDRKIPIQSDDEIGDLVDSFNQMQDSLANLDRMRNDFIANVSHELRTPMTSIGGFIDAILEGVVPPEKQEKYLTIVRNEITRMNTLVNDLLDVARLQSGHTKLDFKREDVNQIATDCISKLEPLIREKGLNTALDFQSQEAYAWVDVPSVTRVFINLIQNAVKFTNLGGTITVRTCAVRGGVQVTVEDTGQGISEEDQKMIFERFYKVDQSRGLDKKGTGLGLSLVKNIMKAHGGSIRVESQLGVGSKFIFTIPTQEPKQTRNEEEHV